MNTTRLTPALIEQIACRITAVADPKKIALFGSYARGEERATSIFW